MSTTTDQEFGIEPSRLYRKTDPATRKILGLKPTALAEAIKNKALPAPVPLTEHGKAAGWYGFTLIQIVKDRLANAESRRAKQAAKAEALLAAWAARPRPTKKKIKKRGR